MRKYAFRKMTHDDFAARVKRVDPNYGRAGLLSRKDDSANARPFISALIGFGWAYVVILIARNREILQDSLTQGALPAHLHDYIFGALAAMLAISGVMILIHLARFFGRAGAKKRNSAGILSGATLALALVYTPAGVIERSIEMLDPNSRALILAASSSVQEAVPGIDFSTVAFVSSQGR